MAGDGDRLFPVCEVDNPPFAKTANPQHPVVVFDVGDELCHLCHRGQRQGAPAARQLRDDYGMAVMDPGLGVGLHEHTGAVVEPRDEVYAVTEAVNPKYMSFAPHVGQLQKGGADAARVVKDFAKITTHLHLKHYSNGKYMGGYCPLGMGVVDLASILNVRTGPWQRNIPRELTYARTTNSHFLIRNRVVGDAGLGCCSGRRRHPCVIRQG